MRRRAGMARRKTADFKRNRIEMGMKKSSGGDRYLIDFASVRFSPRPLRGLERLVMIRRRNQSGVLNCRYVLGCRELVDVSPNNRRSVPLSFPYQSIDGGLFSEPRLNFPNEAGEEKIRRFEDCRNELVVECTPKPGASYSIECDCYKTFVGTAFSLWQLPPGEPATIGKWELTLDISTCLRLGYQLAGRRNEENPRCDFIIDSPDSGRGRKSPARRRPVSGGQTEDGVWTWSIENVTEGHFRLFYCLLEPTDTAPAPEEAILDKLAAALSQNGSLVKDLHHFVMVCHYFVAGYRSWSKMAPEMLTDESVLRRSVDSIEKAIGAELVRRKRGQGLSQITPEGEAIIDWWSRFYRRWTPIELPQNSAGRAAARPAARAVRPDSANLDTIAAPARSKTVDSRRQAMGARSKKPASADRYRIDLYSNRICLRPMRGLERLVRMSQRNQDGVLFCDSLRTDHQLIEFSPRNSRTVPLTALDQRGRESIIGDPRLSFPNEANDDDIGRFGSNRKDLRIHFTPRPGARYYIEVDYYLISGTMGVDSSIQPPGEPATIAKWEVTLDLTAYMDLGYRLASNPVIGENPRCEFMADPSRPSRGRKSPSTPIVPPGGARANGIWTWTIENSQGGVFRIDSMLEASSKPAAPQRANLDGLAAELALDGRLVKDLHNFILICHYYAAGYRSLRAIAAKMQVEQSVLRRRIESIERATGIELFRRKRGQGLIEITPMGEAVIDWWSEFYIQWTPINPGPDLR